MMRGDACDAEALFSSQTESVDEIVCGIIASNGDNDYAVQYYGLLVNMPAVDAPHLCVPVPPERPCLVCGVVAEYCVVGSLPMLIR